MKKRPTVVIKREKIVEINARFSIDAHRRHGRGITLIRINLNDLFFSDLRRLTLTRSANESLGSRHKDALQHQAENGDERFRERTRRGYINVLVAHNCAQRNSLIEE